MLLMPDIRQTTEYRATQLVYSIKFKLSHAIKFKKWKRPNLGRLVYEEKNVDNGQGETEQYDRHLRRLSLITRWEI